MKLSRRRILISMGSAAIVALVGYRKIKSFMTPKLIKGRITGGNFSRGHQIRDPKFFGEETFLEIETLIIGAGVSGLSAGYFLNKKNKKKFHVLDLENRIGGNSSTEKNETGSYPLGAHYLPIPSSESSELKEFLHEKGVITEIKNNLPEYNQYHLCFEPGERLFINGRWQMGLEPNLSLSHKDKKEFKTFFKLMEHFKKSYGTDGKRAFAIPLERSSKDQQFQKYDQKSMEQFFNDHKFNSDYLRWYVNYCCKDDYGVPMDKISAWAGIHYFASRNGEGKGIDSSSVLTWPEGNAFLSHALANDIKDQIKKNVLVYKITKSQDEMFNVKAYDFSSNKILAYKVQNIIYAAPFFTAKKIIDIKSMNKYIRDIEIDYAPWMTANIELDEELASSETPLCWDNVNFHGKSLGYIYANHQHIGTTTATKNITLYWPLIETTSRLARIKALTKTHQKWCEEIVFELEKMHEGIADSIKSVNISLWGHAMAIPKVGFLQNKKFDNEQFVFAHTDQAGVSLFEEGFYQGLNAAKKMARNMT